MYDHGARNRNPVSTLWYGIDPLFEKYYESSPFVYCHCFPTKFIDRNGCEDENPDILDFPKIGPVIPNSLFISWDDPKVKSENCLAKAKAQLKTVGYTCGGGQAPTNIYPYNENKGVDINQAKEGVLYIKKSLQDNIPVLIGIDHEKTLDNPNYDQTTDHFLVIVGMGKDKNGSYFLAYDNASNTENKEDGVSENNKLYVN